MKGGNTKSLEISAAYEAMCRDGCWKIAMPVRSARRIQRDWERHDAYKAVLADGSYLLGSLQMCWWLLNYFVTDWRYPDAATVAEVYYECWQSLAPVEFGKKDDNTMVIIFRKRSSPDHGS